ncbi:leucine--tRNA ligase [Flavobacteriaceae bacterium F08102]|nr:leucine--tRNA ligase [Flavobacteriaceae bacterium F08102]
MNYNFNEIEAKWQAYWTENQTFAATQFDKKPKFYVLDMFPYPSGAGLHVGHPLGYIASDIYARYKRHKGFNVLHPQGYDSFGLPAEQYAIQTGQHPAVTTAENIKTYRRQLDQLGFSFDWSREVRTSDPSYYRWTQWIFIQLFNSWYDLSSNKAEDIQTLISKFESSGNTEVKAACDDDVVSFTSAEWNQFSSKQQQEILLKYRLTFLSETEVNWCPELGTVLANDEIVNGVSERGGYPVVRKKMKQWSMRISAFAERLLSGLDKLDWPQPLKDSQAYWIGKSEGARVTFEVENTSDKISVFTTRPDTIFGVSFMTLAPENDLVQKITTAEQKKAVDAYIQATAKRSERDRMADVKTISGVFTGAYAIHPFSKKRIPIWIGDYVLASYGTGAVMAVPCGDQRDYDFAKHFNLEIPNIFEGVDISKEAFVDKEKTIIANSDFLNGLSYKKATKRAIFELEKLGIGEGKVNYRLRDAVFSRQRYWGEPFPVYYVDGLPQMIDEKYLPIVLPEVEKYLPTEDGKPPLGNAEVWAWDTVKNKVVATDLIDHKTVFPLELNTMPGWAGSSFYFNRYMDPHNSTAFASKEALEYWKEVDLYIGGSEHATGHLLYARFWQKFLFDRGFVPVDEFAKKLINQGMILGNSAFVYRSDDRADLFVSKSIYDQVKKASLDADLSEKLTELTGNYNPSFTKIHVDVSMVNTSNQLNLTAFRKWRTEFNEAVFIGEKGAVLHTADQPSDLLTSTWDDTFVVAREVEKMSKSKYNVVNPDDICAQYGADSLRLYEMFLGPLEQAKPWNTAGLTGVNGFLKKLWRLFFDKDGLIVDDSKGTAENFKTLHKTIKKVEEDIAQFSFNTSVSTFMIAVNELTAQKCHSREILEPLLVLISPYAPHIAEELWEQLGHNSSISTVEFPVYDPSFLVENTKKYPISFNGKVRFTMELPMDLDKQAIEDAVMANEKTVAQLAGRIPKKIIVVPGKIVNIVG